MNKSELIREYFVYLIISIFCVSWILIILKYLELIKLSWFVVAFPFWLTFSLAGFAIITVFCCKVWLEFYELANDMIIKTKIYFEERKKEKSDE